MKASESWMSLRILCLFRVHVAVLYPIRPDLILASLFSFRPIDQIHGTERRFNFRFLSVLLVLHDVSIADAFTCRLDRKCRVPPISILERVKRKTILLVFVWTRLVVCDLDSLQSESLRQMRRNKANDLQFLQIIQGRG